jgi:hypothetical protein
MPFTVSHTALVLPLKKLRPEWFSLTGLMAGAMAPDLQYFLLADTTYRGLSHTWTGLFLVCLPLGLAFCFAFHSLFKRVFIENLPSPLDRHLSGLAECRFAPGGLREWCVLIFSVLLGAVSHFFWDSFTHPEGVLAQHIPWLLKETTLFGIARTNARWAQHVSTALGAVGMVVGLVLFELLPRPVEAARRSPARKLMFWLVGILCGAAWSVAVVLFYNRLFDWQIEDGYSLGLAFQTAALGSWAGFFYYVCAVKLTFRRRTQSRRSRGLDA